MHNREKSIARLQSHKIVNCVGYKIKTLWLASLNLKLYFKNTQLVRKIGSIVVRTEVVCDSFSLNPCRNEQIMFNVRKTADKEFFRAAILS